MTRPYWVWVEEYPEDGAMVVDATGPEEALKKGVSHFNEEEERLACKPVTAEDIHKIQDKVEDLEEAAAQMSKRLQGAGA